jgi:UDP-N-acetylmuramoylalanine--D-glutamate ligase
MTPPEDIAGHVVILGAGRSGRAVAELLAAGTAIAPPDRVSLLDESPVLDAELVSTLRTQGVQVVERALTVPDGAGLFVVSPGIPPSSPLMTAARATGVPIISEIELAWRISRSPWIAVTGTNGKTTTTALISHLLDSAGMPAETVGNIGRPAVTVAAEAGPGTVLVAEVSSFQLANIDRFRPRVSVLLNITPDHIDWHGSFAAYETDKARIFLNQAEGDTAVIDTDDPVAGPWADRVAAGGITVRRIARETLAPGGASVVDGWLSLDGPEGTARLLAVSDLPIMGEHNVSNALAAAAAAWSVGVPASAIGAGLASFSPIAHRLEPVGTAAGVEYFDDSKATNPDAVFKALTAFDDRRVVLLLGGRNKGSDMLPLARDVVRRGVTPIVFGEAAGEFTEAFAALGVTPEHRATMAEAVGAAAALGMSGDVVLLSPACASFDEFDGYAARGEEFARIVRTLAGES